jgi:uncharacterized protein YcbX
MPRISALFIYPVKSARGTPVDTLELDDRGAVGDRRWMVVDDGGVFVSQREEPRMSLVTAALTTSGLRLEAPGMPSLDVARPARGTQSIRGEVWDGHCDVLPADERAHRWISTFLGGSFRFVFQPDDAVLPMLPKYAGAITGERRIAFTDGSPLLLIGQSSLDDLNTRLPAPLPMNRFRPNIVIEGAEPYEEDSWTRVEAAGVLLEVAKGCPRCVTTTVDQATAERGAEPLRTLAKYRKVGSNVMFGQNVAHHRPGRLKVGDDVRIVEVRAAAEEDSTAGARRSG